MPPKSRYDTSVPELPEVETIVRELNRRVRGHVIRVVHTDSPDSQKLIRPLTQVRFRRAVVGRSFLGFERRGKFILARLSEPRRATSRYRPFRPSRRRVPDAVVLLWHMGMTGHPLYRDPRAEARNPKLAQAMADPMNRHVRVTFHFADGTRLEYADIRKFGKIEVVRSADLGGHPQLKKLGPDALVLSRHPSDVRERLKKRRTNVKVALLDQTVIAGVGNIYADEALWASRLHPLRQTRSLTLRECRRLARALRDILQEAIRASGTSIDDFRRLSGTKGGYQTRRKAYQRAGLPCRRCGTLLRRIVVGGRGTHVCSRCQHGP